MWCIFVFLDVTLDFFFFCFLEPDALKDGVLDGIFLSLDGVLDVLRSTQSGCVEFGENLNF